MTHSKWQYKLDFVHLDWPFVDFPKTKYPMDEHEEENKAEAKRCVELVSYINFAFLYHIEYYTVSEMMCHIFCRKTESHNDIRNTVSI